ncbi:MAG: radical SAM protein [bacterium]
MAVRTVYGPVPSRRLGRSLGVDPIPLKTCNWNCIYCQLGRSRPLTSERREYIPADHIVQEVRGALSSRGESAVDWITFVGSGEPLLHSGIGELVRGVRSMTDISLAVITNGSLLYRPEVREAVLPVQAVLPTLDAGSEALYRRINRPHPDTTFEKHIRGMEAFRREFSGRLFVEVMLLQGVNDTSSALEDIAEVLAWVAPDEIHLVVPTRPAVEPWVRAAGRDGIHRAESILARAGKIRSSHLKGRVFNRISRAPEVEELTEIIQRHPMTDTQVRETVERWSPDRSSEILEQLRSSSKVRTVVRDRQTYWVSSTSHFPEGDPIKTKEPGEDPVRGRKGRYR